MQQQYAVDVRINKPFNSLRHFEPILSTEYHLEKKIYRTKDKDNFISNYKCMNSEF